MGRLDQLDLGKKLSQKEYEHTLEKLQLELIELQRRLHTAKRPLIMVFEGWDAAGKGGCIRRLTERMDPRGYVVHAIGAPTADEKAYHYLHRFWLRLPARGRLAIFDRSWYGRVLVERVEGFASRAEWGRAYDEINAFERTLAADGAIIIKCWLHITKSEQLKRFQERQDNPFKQWKLTDDDWRNREKWDDYLIATEDMFARTDTPEAPWTLVEGNYKWHARIKTLRTVVERTNEALG